MDVRVLTIEWAMDRLPQVEQDLLFLERKIQEQEWLQGTPQFIIEYECARVKMLRDEVSYLRSLLGITSSVEGAVSDPRVRYEVSSPRSHGDRNRYAMYAA